MGTDTFNPGASRRSVRQAGLVLAALLSACAGGPQTDAPSEQTAFLDLYAVEADAGVDCISRAAIKSTRVIGDRTIEFTMRGGKRYINILPNTCPGLRPGRTVGFETRQSRLCSLDVVRLYEQSAVDLRPTTGCGLGRFNEVVQGGVVLEDDE